MAIHNVPLFLDHGGDDWLVGHVTFTNINLIAQIIEKTDVVLSPKFETRELTQEVSGFDVKPTSKYNGTWVVFSYNIGPNIHSVHDQEIDAFRAQQALGYGYVKFWEYGTLWEDGN